ncbi:digeranylgeranylglyceryl phosphate synthase [Methanofervidicoccus sp. A16]|uniref:UbiA family prenyltransferase n=1 Tax=Methanofervidicoccus sp. A16 TaxID=2607662 RepID=UPI00118AE854|nr:UbiA family prenyltransferase [Methanofervidicoccus sp. A16]AXI25355.1 digeranylgeranylglyceryl phosphate synthase [Methanofervidicoccus sp. A16]MBW9220567.1 UbiA family prenyltransferase [Methanothermococcus sp. SCGC AD-155-N22]
MGIKDYMDLIRVKNCLIASFGTVIAGLIASNFNIHLLDRVLLAALVVFLICGFGNVINDIYDIDIDRINKPHRPLPSGRISLKSAKILVWIMAISGLLISLFNWICFIIALVNTLILYLYAKRFKRDKRIGNLLVAYLTGSVFLFGGASVGNIFITFILFLCAMLTTWAREIVKDFEDIEGDRSRGVLSLPIKYGKRSLYLALGLLILAIILSPLPYLIGIFNSLYLLGILFCDTLLLYSIVKLLKNPTKEEAHRCAKEIKMIISFILVSFIVGAVYG